jgi:peptidoglycan/LPS O-acetylase OafA/YrhL
MKVIAKDDKHRLALVDALRCFAALWVVLFHMSEGRHIPSLIEYLPSWVRYIIFDAGHLGVSVFFVLSGIVMAVTTFQVPMTNRNTFSFVIRRLVRLVPPYYAAVVFGIAVIAIKNISGQYEILIPSLKVILAHLVFLPGFLGMDYILMVFWTLCIEVQFYIAFAFLLWVADQYEIGIPCGIRSWAIWISAFLAALWPAQIVHSSGWDGSFIGFWYSFMAGVLCGQALNRTRKSFYIAICYGALILSIGTVRQDTFALCAGLTSILFCLLVNIAGGSSIFNSYPVQKLGLISYSLYLFHSPVTGFFMRLYRHFISTSVITDVVAVLMTVMSCIAIATVAYFLIERPAIFWSRKIKLKRVMDLNA